MIGTDPKMNPFSIPIAAIFTTAFSDTDQSVCFSCHLSPGRNECTSAVALSHARVTFRDIQRSNRTDALQEAKSELADYVTVCDPSMPYCVIERIIGESEFLCVFLTNSSCFMLL